MQRDTVLFLCPHGAAKSVLAAAYFQQQAAAHGLALRAICAGTEPDPVVAPAVAALVAREQLELPVEHPQLVAAAEVAGAAWVISLGCALEELPAAPAGWEAWQDIPPPSQDLDRAWALIRQRVDGLVARLKERAQRG
jgi:arsenate reductase